jgi:hypothetical protein
VFFSKFFKSSQVRDCEIAIRLLRPTFTEAFASALVFDEIEKEVLKAIRQNSETVQKKMLLEDQTAQTTVIHIISNLALRECSSGMNHNYRGVL